MSSEAKLRALLDEALNLPVDLPAVDPRRQASNGRLLAWVDEHLRDNLKGAVAQAFGPQVLKDTELRFSLLWSDVVERVLRKAPSRMWEAAAAKKLTEYFSVALCNRARDYLRRRKSRREVSFEGDSPDGEALRILIDSRTKHLADRHGVDYSDLIEQIDLWMKSPEPLDQDQGRALRYRYVDGMTYPEIGEQLSVDHERAKYLCRTGLARLKQHALASR